MKVLLFTNKPGVFNSFQDDVANHVDFDNMKTILLKEESDKSNVILNEDEDTIVLCSKQLADNLISGPKVREFLASHKWDMAFIDECHSGTDTDTFRALVESLDIDFTVKASGTPFKTAATGNYTEKNSFFYGYTEQQRDKRAGLIDGAVTLKTYVPQINPEIVNNPAFTTEEGFTLTKLFSFDKKTKQFVHAGNVRQFIADILNKSNNKSKFSPMAACPDSLDHTVWLLPADVNMIAALKKVIEDVAPEYKVINASGNATKNIDKAKDVIARNEKTITLTNMRFIEGTTVREWTGTFVLSDTDSVEKYFQFIFRGASPDKGKDVAYVFDFNPERQLSMTYEMAMATAVNNNDTDSQGCITEWLDCNNVFHAREGGPGFAEVDVENVLNLIKKDDYTNVKLLKTSHDYVNLNNATDSIAQLFDGVSPNKKIVKTTLVASSGIEGARNMNRTVNPSEKEEIDLDTLELLQKQLATIVSSLPAITLLFGVNTVEDLLSIQEEDIDIIFEEATGVTRSTLRAAVDANILNTRSINLHL